MTTKIVVTIVILTLLNIWLHFPCETHVRLRMRSTNKDVRTVVIFEICQPRTEHDVDAALFKKCLLTRNKPMGDIVWCYCTAVQRVNRR